METVTTVVVLVLVGVLIAREAHGGALETARANRKDSKFHVELPVTARGAEAQAAS